MSEIKKTQTSEIDLYDIFQLLWKKKKFVISFSAIFTILAIIYSLLATPFYSSYVSIYPIVEGNNNSSIGDLQGIASTFGINIGGQNQTSFNIPDIVNSRVLKKAVILNKWNSQKFDDSVNLITYWEIDDTTGFSLRGFLSGLFTPSEKTDPHQAYLESAIETIGELISVKEEDSGLIVISVLSEDPQLSADIVNFIAEYIKNYVSEEMFAKSTEHRQFIENRMVSSKGELSDSEVALTEFRKKHPMALDTPDLQLDRGRLMRNVEVNQQVYITLRQQHELAKIEELKEAPVINILDKGEAAVEKTKPRRSFIVFISLLCSIFISVAIVLFKNKIDLLTN